MFYLRKQWIYKKKILNKTLLAHVRELFIEYLDFSLCHTFLCKSKNIAEWVLWIYALGKELYINNVHSFQDSTDRIFNFW